jgi:N-acetylglucosaminyl-diphospho-decaprenol L-rhamnosyltransferase
VRRVDLAIQIVNFNTKAHLRPCLHSVIAALGRSGLDARALVLENGSDDDLRDLAGHFGDAVEIHYSDVNLGFGGGHNRLARATRSRYLCFLNPDVLMPADGDVFGALLGACSGPGVAIAGPMLVGEDGAPQRWDHGELHGLRARISNGAGAAYWRERHDRADVAWVSGACMVIERDAFESVGGFDEGFFLYKEEEDLSLQVRRAGARVVYEPGIRVTHVGSVVAKRAQEHFRPSIDHYLRKNFPHRWRRRLLLGLYLGWARRG